MKRYFFLLMLSMFLIGYGNAGATDYGLKFSFGYSNISVDTWLGRSNIGFKFIVEGGGLINHNFNDNIGLRAELLYSMRGAGSTYDLGYITIPLLLRVSPDLEDLSVFVGPQIGFKANGNEVLQDTDINITDLAITGGLEIFLFKDFYIDLRYNRSLASITNTGENYNYAIMLGIGKLF